MENLTFEEAAVVGMYRKVSRRETVSAMMRAREYLEPDGDGTRETLDGAIQKLERMTDREFADADLSVPFDSDDLEVNADGG